MTELHWIDGPWQGRLATMARPRGGDWLEDDLAMLRRLGVTVLVSLLEPAEVEELDLGRERHFWITAGLTFHSYPVPDYGVPASSRPFLETAARLVEALQAGQVVAIHCRMGIGRSSLLAAAILGRAGVSPDDAWQRISLARGLRVPDTDEQRRWLDEHVKEHVPESH